MNHDPTIATFTPHVGEALRLGFGKTLVLRAIETPTAAAAELPSRSPFALLLRGPRSAPVPEGTHRLTLQGGETFDLYVIPIHTPSSDHQDYQIVFN